MRRLLLTISVLLGTGVLLCGCNEDVPQSTASSTSGAWNASFRVNAGSLTEAELSQASWVRVEAWRGGVVLVSKEASYDEGSVALTIPSAGDVWVTLYGYGDETKSSLVWSGSGLVANRTSDPGLNAVTLVAYGSVTDAAGQSYKTVLIGTQTWMAENLNYSKGGTIGVCYNADSGAKTSGPSDTCAKYGRLYTWAEVMNVSSSYNESLLNPTLPAQGICPTGWHLPRDAEWTTLCIFVNGRNTDEGTKLKSISGWSTNEGTDLFGFRALPGGERASNGSFYSGGSFANFWSSSEGGASWASYHHLSAGNETLYRYDYYKTYGFSARCLKD